VNIYLASYDENGGPGSRCQVKQESVFILVIPDAACRMARYRGA